MWEEGIFMEWGCVTPTHRSGMQTGVHQTFFLRSETLPASLEAMAKSASDTTTHWRGCVDLTKIEDGETVHGTDNYQCYIDTMHGTRGIRKGLLWGLAELSDKHGYSLTDVEKAVCAKSLELVQETGALKVGELVPVCTAMWKMSELTDYWGYYGSDEVVLDTRSVFHQFADILLYMVVGEESKPKARSAMARARKLSKNLQTAAIMMHVRNAIKGAEYRQYKTQAEERLSEVTRMIDLDSDDNAVRESAFGAVLPTFILQAQHVASVFAQQLDEDMVMWRHHSTWMNI